MKTKGFKCEPGKSVYEIMCGQCENVIRREGKRIYCDEKRNYSVDFIPINPDEGINLKRVFCNGFKRKINLSAERFL